MFSASLLEAADIKGVRLTIATPEEKPLQVFGSGATSEIGDLLAQRDIEVVTGVHPLGVEGGHLNVVPRGEIEASAVIAMPRHEGRVVEGIKCDPKGFVAVDEHCRIAGTQRLFAVGDVTTFPVKQGGIATQQADSAAAMIAAELGAPVEPAPFDPVLRSVLLTGESPRYLHARFKGGQGEKPFLSEEPPGKLAEAKIFGRYLTSFLAELRPADD
jgi:sulfide:quinone oxidoreductase